MRESGQSCLKGMPISLFSDSTGKISYISESAPKRNTNIRKNRSGKSELYSAAGNIPAELFGSGQLIR